MEKIRNKFIILIFLLIVFILFIGIYKSFFVQIDRNTYAILISGEGRINEELLITDSRELLHIGDIVKTIGNDSLLVIEWGDGSVTRLGGNSSLKINELYVDKDLLQINLSFELLSGKSWSNVLNFMGSKSYFKESFRDIEAGVRGTVFNVDLENNYINVIKHKLELTGDNVDNLIIEENKPFSIKTFSFIKLSEFIKNIKNRDFENLNVKFDIKLLNGLKDKINQNLDKFALILGDNWENLPIDKKNELYNELLSKYQELNFIDANDEELFGLKLDYKQALLKLAGNEEKPSLIQNTFYDFKDSIESKKYLNLEKILPILNENKNILEKLNIDFGEYFKNISLNDELKQVFGKNLNILKNIFGVDFSNNFPDISFEGIKSKAIELYTNSGINSKLNEQVGFIKKFLQILFNK